MLAASLKHPPRPLSASTVGRLSPKARPPEQ
jgi:hypothetical protein